MWPLQQIMSATYTVVLKFIWSVGVMLDCLNFMKNNTTILFPSNIQGTGPLNFIRLHLQSLHSILFHKISLRGNHTQVNFHSVNIMYMNFYFVYFVSCRHENCSLFCSLYCFCTWIYFTLMELYFYIKHNVLYNTFNPVVNINAIKTFGLANSIKETSGN